MWLRKKVANIEDSNTDSGRALKKSLEDLDEIKSRDRDVENVVVDMLIVRKNNHFAEQITALMSRTLREGG